MLAKPSLYSVRLKQPKTYENHDFYRIGGMFQDLGTGCKQLGLPPCWRRSLGRLSEGIFRIIVDVSPTVTPGIP